MRIGYEAKRAFLNMTGLGNYSRELIRMIAAAYPKNEYYLYTPKTKPNSRLTWLTQYSYIKTIVPKRKFLTALWRSKFVVNDLQRDAIDVYHGLSHELPLGIGLTGIKTVVTIHDLIFLRFPQYFGVVSRLIYAAKIRYACKTADSIIAISQQTKDDLVELLKVDPAKIEVVYQGCDKSFNTQATAEQKLLVKQKYSLPERFILNVGTIEARKNLLLLVNALHQLPEATNLVVIGKKTPYFEEVQKAIDSLGIKTIRFLGNVDFEDLPVIYQLSALFVYPSRYEGFGLPVLEAMTSGVPVIAATGSCLEEAGGPNSIYIDPDDAPGLANNIARVLSDEKLQQTMTANGFIYARNFDEPKLATMLMDIYNKINQHECERS